MHERVIKFCCHQEFSLQIRCSCRCHTVLKYLLPCFPRSAHRMFFFFVFSHFPESRVIQRAVASCPRCLSPADLIEQETVTRVFFVPVWRSKASGPIVACNNCGFRMSMEEFSNMQEQQQRQGGYQNPTLPDSGPGYPTPQPPASAQRSCWNCGASAEATFAFCPYCGATLQ